MPSATRNDVLAEVIARFDQLQGERYLLITGDHGQLLGEGGRWRPGNLLPQVAEVPVMVLAREAPEAALGHCARNSGSATTRPGCGWPSAPRPAGGESQPGRRRHFVQGKQLFGDNMIQRVQGNARGPGVR